MTNYDLVKKVIGKITPIGESSIDAERFENLKEMCHLVEMLLMDISDMAYTYEDDKQPSIVKCVKYANEFCNKNRK